MGEGGGAQEHLIEESQGKPVHWGHEQRGRERLRPVPGLQPSMTWEINQTPARLHLPDVIKSQDSNCKVRRLRYHGYTAVSINSPKSQRISLQQRARSNSGSTLSMSFKYRHVWGMWAKSLQRLSV